MAPNKGFRHTDESRAKMSASRKGKPKPEGFAEKISAANKGRVRERDKELLCPCGASFLAANITAIYCSLGCKRAIGSGHGRVNHPSYANFDRVCAICGRDSDLVGDHDHETGYSRGILCRNCNLGLGNFYDSIPKLRAAIRYLGGE